MTQQYKLHTGVWACGQFSTEAARAAGPSQPLAELLAGASSCIAIAVMLHRSCCHAASCSHQMAHLHGVQLGPLCHLLGSLPGSKLSHVWLRAARCPGLPQQGLQLVIGPGMHVRGSSGGFCSGIGWDAAARREIGDHTPCGQLGSRHGWTWCSCSSRAAGSLLRPPAAAAVQTHAGLQQAQRGM